MSTRSSSASSAPPKADPAAPPAKIQRDGFLIALTADWRIQFASDNVGDLFADLGPRAAGQPLSEFFGSEAVHALRNRLALMRDPDGSARLFALVLAGLPRQFDIAIHLAGDNVILEAFPGGSPGAADPAGMVRETAAALDGLDEQAILELATRHLRALTGYERVSLFRTSEGALVQVADMGSKTPLSPPQDFPRRPKMIADIEAETCNLGGRPEPALSGNVILACPSEGERAELMADGSRSALLLPLRSAGRDVGLAWCRSQSPRRIRLDRLTAAELYADMLAMRIELCALRK